MIIPQTKHIFQDCLPKLEEGEEEIFYQHPEWDIKINQIGVIYPGESMTYYSYSVLSERVNLNDLKTIKLSIPKNKLLAQCFAGSMEVPFQIIPLDGNPYNTTSNNLIYPESFKFQASENYRTFKYNSLEYMLKKEKKLKDNVFPGVYWSLQKLPDYLRNMYEKETKISLALDQYGFPKQTSWGESRTKRNKEEVKRWRTDARGRKRTNAQVNDLRKRAHELFNSGMTKTEIAKEMKETSTYIHYLMTSKYSPEKSKN